MRSPLHFIILSAATFVFAAADHPTTIPTASAPAPNAHILMKFPMDIGVGRGNAIILPVKVGQQETLFVLDTGATYSVLDLATKGLGDLVGTEEINSVSTQLQIKKFRAPPMEISGYPISFEKPILGSDFRLIREVSGQPITGVLGMDFLSHYVLQLDFKNRQILFLDPASPPPKNADTFTIGHSFGCPVILADFLAPNNVLKLDTGCNQDGTVRPTFIEPLGIPFSRIRTMATEASGNIDQNSYVVHASWTFVGTHYTSIELSPGLENVMGLRILANYIVTLDFPHDRAYFQPYRQEHPLPLRHIGFGIIARNGQRMISYIDEPTIAAGLQKDDRILSLDGKNVDNMPLWQLHEFLATQSKSTLRIQRGNQTIETVLQQPTTPISQQ